MRYVFDLDGTLCETREMNYDYARPIWRRIRMVNDLYDEGHYIVIDTARGNGTGDDWHDRTAQQLADWGVQYHELHCGRKPWADVYVDDRGQNVLDWEGVPHERVRTALRNRRATINRILES